MLRKIVIALTIPAAALLLQGCDDGEASTDSSAETSGQGQAVDGYCADFATSDCESNTENGQACVVVNGNCRLDCSQNEDICKWCAIDARACLSSSGGTYCVPCDCLASGVNCGYFASAFR